MVREREEAGGDILYLIEQEVSTEASKVVAFGLKSKNTTRGSKLGGIKGIESDVSANVVEDIAIPQVVAQPFNCLWLFGSVGVRTMVFIRRRDADGNRESINLAMHNWTNRTPGCTKRQHHRQRYSIQLGKEPSTHLMFQGVYVPCSQSSARESESSASCYYCGTRTSTAVACVPADAPLRTADLDWEKRSLSALLSPW